MEIQTHGWKIVSRDIKQSGPSWHNEEFISDCARQKISFIHFLTCSIALLSQSSSIMLFIISAIKAFNCVYLVGTILAATLMEIPMLTLKGKCQKFADCDANSNALD